MAKSKNKFILLGALGVMATACVSVGVASFQTGYAVAEEGNIGGATEYTVTVDGQTLEGISIDPIIWSDVALDSQSITTSERFDEAKTLNASKSLIYTASFPYSTTKRTGNYIEYTVEYDGTNKAYKVVSVSETGNSYIPVGGYVLSVPTDNAWTAEEGDVIELSGNYKLADKVIESNTGRRINVDKLNGDRNGSMTVYYDYDFGAKTGTNVYGTEMVAVFDSESGTFKVTDFRAFYEGDDSGIEIPDNGFVLSCYGNGYRGRLVEGQRFNIGDELTMLGFDYLRFGGTVTYNYDYVYGADTDPTKESDANYNPGAWDTATSSYFPAYRGTNQMIIYQDGWDPDKDANTKSGTGVNTYGYEVAVNADGVVVERNVQVSEIPVGGYVISGHQDARDFIRASIPLGSDIVLDSGKKQISVTTSLNAFYMNTVNTAQNLMVEAQGVIEDMYDVDRTTLQEKITALGEALTDLETEKNSVLAKLEEAGLTDKAKMQALMGYNTKKLEVEDLTYEILALSKESEPVTARAVWHRPVEKSYDKLIETLDTYEECGFNLIFVESFFNGYSMFKGQYVEYHPQFAGVTYGEYDDYLSAFVTEAGKRGIEVHAWVEDFYVGLKADISLLSGRSHWIMYNNTKDNQNNYTFLQKNEGGPYVFIDPTNKEVTDFLVNYYKELLDEHPAIKGLNLDYIRYPVSSFDEDTGYTKNAMLGFAEKYPLSNIRILETQTLPQMITQFQKYFNKSYVGSDEKVQEYYQYWCDYRKEAVTSFVERIYTEVKADRDILLSTAVFSSLSETTSSKKQDWRTWFRNGWIDIATPMAYFTAAADVQEGVTSMIWAAGNNCYYYTGLASSYSGLPAYENNYQIQASYDAGANGYVIFCSTQVIGHDDVQQVLKAGVNSKTAVLPHADAKTVLGAYFNTVLDRAQRLYLPAGHTTDAKLASLEAKFNDILAMDMDTAGQLTAVKTAVSNLAKKTSSYVVGKSRARVADLLNDAVALLETKIAILGPVSEGGGVAPDSSSSDSVTDSTGDSTQNSQTDKKKGCGSEVAFVIPTLLTLAGVGLVTARKQRKEN